MLIAGDLSGIQNYLFDVAHEGGAQARRLRARSFFMQLLAEIAALRVLKAVGWQSEQILFCAAGKFILQGEALTQAQMSDLQLERQKIDRWLLQETGAQLRFSLSVSEEKGTARLQYDEAMSLLEKEKRRAWSNLAITEDGWQTDSLILALLDNACDLCRRREAVVSEIDDETDIAWRVCSTCHRDREIGKRLPRVADYRYAVVTEKMADAEKDENNVFVIGGWHVSLTRELPTGEGYAFDLDYKARSNGAKPAASAIEILPRRLARHIPARNEKPIEFVAMAEEARGDGLLGILKMDGDSLGRHINGLLQNGAGMKKLSDFSKELEDFFAVNLSRCVADSYRDSIYTIFAGGDDLLLVGRWNEVFDFAGEVHRLFSSQFGARHLTISGGIAFFKPKYPIRLAARRADELLEDAKTKLASREDESKNQIAAFGQVWKWKHHRVIAETAKRVASWIEDKKFQRGWLHTLLRLSLQRQESGSRTERELATSRLAYQVARNYPRKRGVDSIETQIRSWADLLIEDFEQMEKPETFYLPAIARYALTATRSKAKEE